MSLASNDLELLERWGGGDRCAGEALLARHFDALCRFFRNKLPDAVDDLIQRTMLKLVESRARFEGRSSVRIYLFAIARHELFDEMRRRRHAGDRIALELYFWGDMSASEIGRILETPEGTVRTRIRRAKQLLEQEMDALSSGEGSQHTTAARIETWAQNVRNRLAG